LLAQLVANQNWLTVSAKLAVLTTAKLLLLRITNLHKQNSAKASVEKSALAFFLAFF
jgi:hypothetical protein